MEKVKTKLIEIAIQYKNENNDHYWDKVIYDVENCKDILDLFFVGGILNLNIYI